MQMKDIGIIIKLCVAWAGPVTKKVYYIMNVFFNMKNAYQLLFIIILVSIV